MIIALIFAPALALQFTRPSPQLSPATVVQAQLEALSAGDVSTCFEFASPENKRATGPWQKFEMMVRQTPAYSPLVSCSSFEILSTLPISEDTWQARVAVKPAGSSSAPFAIANPLCYYRWLLSRQPADAAQSDSAVAGCWMVDGVMPDKPTPEE